MRKLCSLTTAMTRTNILWLIANAYFPQQTRNQFISEYLQITLFLSFLSNKHRLEFIKENKVYVLLKIELRMEEIYPNYGLFFFFSCHSSLSCSPGMGIYELAQI